MLTEMIKKMLLESSISEISLEICVILWLQKLELLLLENLLKNSINNLLMLLEKLFSVLMKIMVLEMISNSKTMVLKSSMSISKPLNQKVKKPKENLKNPLPWLLRLPLNPKKLISNMINNYQIKKIKDNLTIKKLKLIKLQKN